MLPYFRRLYEPAFLKTISAPFSRSTVQTTNSMAIPTPSVPPYRKRVVHITYEIYDQAYHHGRRKEAKFIFAASYDTSDNATEVHHADDYCRKCQTTYYKRYVTVSHNEAQPKQADNQQLKYVQARGEIRRLCSNCRKYFQVLMDDVKQIIGKSEKDVKF